MKPWNNCLMLFGSNNNKMGSRMDKYYNPVRTYLGSGIFANATSILKEAAPNAKEILLLVWHPSVLENSTVQQFLSAWPYPVATLVFEHSNPTVENLFELYEKSRMHPYNLVLAIGGGSVLDVGKILACMQGMTISSCEDIRTIIANQAYAAPICQWVGVPTTSGTGSEVTCWATIWDVTKGKKLSVEHTQNYAVAAIVDDVFSESMPMALAVSSALDAVAHATESYWAKDRNPVTQALALYAIRTIIQSLDALTQGSAKKACYKELAKGSMMAGLAFSNTKTTACHSISYPLTMHYNVPHGIAVSLLIAPMIVFNEDFLEDKQQLLHAFGVEEITQVQSKIFSILTWAGVCTRLREWEIEENDIDFLVKNAFTKGRIDNNPKLLTEQDVTTLLKNMY